MDAAALTRLVIALLTPLTHNMGASLPNEKNEEFYQHSQRLYELLQTRFASEHDDGRARKALQLFLENPENSVKVEKKLFPLLQTDPIFADKLRSVIKTGPRQALTAEEENEARRIRMVNTLAIGRPEIRAGKHSTLEDVQMNLS